MLYVFIGLSKIAARYNHDLTKEENDKSKKDPIVFDDNVCITKMVDTLMSLKDEPKN